MVGSNADFASQKTDIDKERIEREDVDRNLNPYLGNVGISEDTSVAPALDGRRIVRLEQADAVSLHR